jgi:hypothetical protein
MFDPLASIRKGNQRERPREDERGALQYFCCSVITGTHLSRYASHLSF